VLPQLGPVLVAVKSTRAKEVPEVKSRSSTNIGVLAPVQTYVSKMYGLLASKTTPEFPIPLLTTPTWAVDGAPLGESMERLERVLKADPVPKDIPPVFTPTCLKTQGTTLSVPLSKNAP
jgi:hypothetical protein